MRSDPDQRPDGPGQPLPVRLIRRLLPMAEREEVLLDLAVEQRQRQARDGRLRGGLWLWRQVVLSVPALVGRTYWRGRTGFEPEANRMRTGGPMVETWLMDVRFAVRRLLKRPLYAALAVLTLALGVGGTAAIAGVVRELLLSPLPIAAEEDVAVWWMAGNWSEAELLHLRSVGTPGFESVAAYVVQDMRLGEAGNVRVVPAVIGSAELFEVLGVRPRIGPGFSPEDDAEGAAPKLILSHGLWQELGADPALVGRTVDVAGQPQLVAGVMPAGFWFPDPSVRLWVTRGFNPQARSGWFTLLGRLEPGQTAAQVDHALQQISASLASQFQYPPEWDNSHNPQLTPVRERIVGPARPVLLATLVAMGVILLMACANVAALMLGQTETRATELSVRSALGAGRGRITQQLIAEGIALGLVAGVAGAAVAAACFRLLLAALPLGAMAETASLDWSVFWIALVLALGAALLVALIPVLSVMRADLSGGLTSGRTGGIAGRGGRLENGLVVAEVALAVVVAAGAALLVRSVGNMRAVDVGLEAAGVAVVDVILPGDIAPPLRTQLLAEIVAGLETLPGAEQAAAVQRLPLRAGGDNWGLQIEGRPSAAEVTTTFRVVTRDYFQVMGARLVSGRLFDASDRTDTEMVAIINETLARQHFGGENPLGMRLGEFDDYARIIGVVADLQERGLTDEPHPARYLLYDQVPYAPTANTLVIRAASGGDAMALAAAARQVVSRAAPPAGIQEITTMQRVVGRALGPARQLMSLLGLLAMLALTLGGIGVYGVVSHFVARRRRDWGIRMALGYRPGQVVGHVTGRGVMLVSAGVILGTMAAAALTRVLAAFVYGVGTIDAAAFAAAGLALLATGAFGAVVPAVRASRVDPARVLREQ